jgi:hypothetical protein
MVEVLGSGRDPDNRTGNRSGRNLTVAVGILVVVGLIVAAVVHGHQQKASSTPSSATLANRFPTGEPPSVPPPPCRSCGAPTVPATAGHSPAGVQLFVGGRTLQTLDARTGGIGAGPAIPVGAGEHVADIRAVGGRYAVLVRPGALDTDGTADQSGPPGVVYLTDRHGPAVRVGLADALLDGSAGSVWLQRFSRPARGEYQLSRLDASGRPGRPVTVNSAYTAIRMTPHGLLATAAHTTRTGSFWGARQVLLISTYGPTRQRLLTSAAVAVIAATDDRVVWSEAPDRLTSCSLVDGSYRTSTYAGADPATYGSLSPDGRRLALGYDGPPGLDDQPARFGVIRVVTGAGKPADVAGVSTLVGHPSALHWTASGLLVLGVADGTRVRLALWNPAGARAIALTIEDDSQLWDSLALIGP